MNPSYIKYIANKLAFPDEAVEYFVEGAKRIADDGKAGEKLLLLILKLFLPH